MMMAEPGMHSAPGPNGQREHWWQRLGRRMAGIGPGNKADLEEAERRLGVYQDQQDHLRQMRADITTLIDLLGLAQQGQLALKSYDQEISRAISAADGHVTQVVTLQKDHTLASDSVEVIVREWDQAKASPVVKAPQTDLAAQDQLHAMTVLNANCRAILYQIGLITIPDRISGWLDMLRPGDNLDFHEMFQDELPSREDRVKLLNYIAHAPNYLAGAYVEVADGLIYKYSANALKQLGSVVVLLLALVGSGYVGYDAGLLLGLVGIKITAEPFVVWLAILGGIVVHLLIGTAKGGAATGPLPPVTTLADIPRLINAKLTFFVRKLGLVLVALAALVLSGKGADAFTAFLVGYSLDSVVDVIQTTLDQRASATTSALRRDIGLTTN